MMEEKGERVRGVGGRQSLRREQVCEGKEQVYQGCICLHLTETSLHWLNKISGYYSHM